MFDAWEMTNASQDPVELFKLKQSSIYKCSEFEQRMMAFVKQDIRLYTMHQKNVKTFNYLKQVKGQVDL